MTDPTQAMPTAAGADVGEFDRVVVMGRCPGLDVARKMLDSQADAVEAVASLADADQFGHDGEYIVDQPRSMASKPAVPVPA